MIGVIQTLPVNLQNLKPWTSNHSIFNKLGSDRSQLWRYSFSRELSSERGRIIGKSVRDFIELREIFVLTELALRWSINTIEVCSGRVDLMLIYMHYYFTGYKPVASQVDSKLWCLKNVTQLNHMLNQTEKYKM